MQYGNAAAGAPSSVPTVPSALHGFSATTAVLEGRQPLLMLDFDGTLAPITPRPEAVRLSPALHRQLRQLARLCPVAVVSGRDLTDLRRRIGLPIWYAGSHGLEIQGPDGRRLVEMGGAYLGDLRSAAVSLEQRLARVPGALVEPKGRALAIHFRLVEPDAVAQVHRAVEDAARRFRLRRSGGKQVLELGPDIDWDKGSAVGWLTDAMAQGGSDAAPLYVGDDATDEDAFRAVAESGIGVLVSRYPRNTAARFRLAGPGQVFAFLDRFQAWLLKGQ